MQPNARVFLIVGSLGLSLTGCSLAGVKTGKDASPTPAAQHDSGPTAGRSDSQSTADQRESSTITSANDIKDNLHTPAKGTEERQAIMDGLREEFNNRQSPYYTPHRGAIVFVVNRLQVHDGWAWMFGYPQSSDPQDSFGEYSGFLLHKQDGRWATMRLPPATNDPNDPEKLDYPSRRDVEKIRQKFPTAPSDIFSK